MILRTAPISRSDVRHEGEHRAVLCFVVLAVQQQSRHDDFVQLVEDSPLFECAGTEEFRTGPPPI